MQTKSRILLFLDEDPTPIASFKSPVKFEMDTTKLVDGKHVLKIVSKDPKGTEGIRLIPFEVRNGPAIDVEGIKADAIVDGVLPIMINAYGKGNSSEFYIEGSETPKSVPAWVWILLIGFVGWAVYYLFTYINIVPD